MPIDDWTRVPSGLFHNFHQRWTVGISNTLNGGLMPQGYYAYVEQKAGSPELDVIAVETVRSGKKRPKEKSTGRTAILEAPRTRVVHDLDSEAPWRRPPSRDRSLSAHQSRSTGHPPRDFG